MQKSETSNQIGGRFSRSCFCSNSEMSTIKKSKNICSLIKISTTTTNHFTLEIAYVRLVLFFFFFFGRKFNFRLNI